MEPKVVILARASSGKQINDGDTLENQIRECELYIKSQEWKKDRIFPFVESGSIEEDERKYFEEVISYCSDSKNQIKYLLFRNISRLTRGGDAAYLSLKSRLQKFGVEIRDIYGTIQPKINTMASLDFEYKWSSYFPSQQVETYEANKHRDYVRDSLTQMIGAEIRYTNKGYWSRGSIYGFVNKKVDTVADGKRNVLSPHPDEAKLVIKMYELRLQGLLDEKEICEKINALGFKTRLRAVRDRKTKQVLRYSGNNPLTPKILQRTVAKPTYAGIICEKWTHFQPVKAKFPGLVSIETFNKVNEGKVYIEVNGDNINITKRQKLPNRRDNPLYPFKKIILCPVCKKPLRGSGSRGKRKVYPAYHCSDKHKLWRIPRDKFHTIIYDFIRSIKFSSPFLKLFEEVFLEVYQEKRRSTVEESALAERNVSDLVGQQKLVLDAFKSATTKEIRNALEKDYQKLQSEIEISRSLRNKKEETEQEVKVKLEYALYFIEHLEELLIDEANPAKQRQLFGLLFETPPTFDEIKSRTPKLSPIFEISMLPSTSKSQLVTPLEFESKFPE